jgi:predicted small lipoprotein YifL
MLGSMSHSLPVRRHLKSLARTLIATLLGAVLLCASVGCGNKGPLYLPDEPMPEHASNPDGAEEAAEDGEEDSEEQEDRGS